MAYDKISGQMNNGYVQDYSALRTPKVQEAPAAPARVGALPQEDQSSKQDYNNQVESASQVTRKDTPVEDLTIGFNTKDSSLVGFGGNFNIATTDMRNAILAMQKDQVLHQYQYFVGSNQALGNVQDSGDAQSNIIYSGEEGVVLRK